MFSHFVAIAAMALVMSLGACRSHGPERGSADRSSPSEEAEHKLETKLRRIIVDELGVQDSDVNMKASLSDDLDADDNDKAALRVRLEEEFGLTIPVEDAEQMRTVGDLYNYVKQHSKQ